MERLFATLAALITLKIKDAVCDKIRHHSGGRPAKFVSPLLATEAPVSAAALYAGHMLAVSSIVHARSAVASDSVSARRGRCPMRA